MLLWPFCDRPGSLLYLVVLRSFIFPLFYLCVRRIGLRIGCVWLPSLLVSLPVSLSLMSLPLFLLVLTFVSRRLSHRVTAECIPHCLLASSCCCFFVRRKAPQKIFYVRFLLPEKTYMGLTGNFLGSDPDLCETTQLNTPPSPTPPENQHPTAAFIGWSPAASHV